MDVLSTVLLAFAATGAQPTAATEPAEGRVAVIGHVRDWRELPECAEAPCVDQTPRYLARVAVDAVVRGTIDIPEVTVRLVSDDNGASETRGAVLVVWVPDGSAAPLAVAAYPADPRVDGGWGVCGDVPRRTPFQQGPTTEPMRFTTVFGNASRLTPYGFELEFVEDYYEVDAAGDVRCVQGYALDTLIDYPAWTEKKR